MPAQLTYTIRPMVETDLDEVLLIEQASFSAPWRREHFLHEIDAPHSFPFVAVVADSVVGYVCLISLFEDAEILDIAVKPEQRGRGIARILMEHAIADAMKLGAWIMRLEVRASNVAAIALYERFGFARSGIRSKYYDGKEDAVLMELQIVSKEQACSLHP